MSGQGSGKQSRRNQPEAIATREKPVQEQEQTLELDASTQLNADLAQVLQPQMGNEALQQLMTEEEVGQESAQAAQVGHNEAQVEESERETDQDLSQELHIPSFGGEPGGSGGEGDSPWDVGLLFGGDDDTPNGPRVPKKQGRRPRRGRNRGQEQLIQDIQDENIDDAHAEQLSAIRSRMRWPKEDWVVDRSGDARYLAIEGTLDSPLNLARPEWEPEDLLLLHRSGAPLIVGGEIGGFLAAHAQQPRSTHWGTLLHQGVPAALHCRTGFTSTVAATAHLTTCAQAAQLNGSHTANAVATALQWQAWSDTVAGARKLAKEGRLHAPSILLEQLGSTYEYCEDPVDSVLDPLCRAAIQNVLPKGFIPDIPRFQITPKTNEDTELIRSLDAALKMFTGSSSSETDDSGQTIHAQDLEPHLYAARQLLNAIGRSQVEFATAALAVLRVQALAPVLPILQQADQELRVLARSAVQAGKIISSMIGRSLHEGQGSIQQGIHQLEECKKRLVQTQDQRFNQLAQALTTPREATPEEPSSDACTAPYSEAFKGLEYLRNGQQSESISHLGQSWNQCVEQQDSLGILTIGSFFIGAKRWFEPSSPLLNLTSIMNDAAKKRKNWLSISHICLLEAEPFLATGAIQKGTQTIVDGLSNLRKLRSSPAAIHLLLAKLIELRIRFGADQIDPILEG